MEMHRRSKRSPSGDKFSFPVITPDEFEFGSATSPASPADHLFSNGKLLPHSFPIQSPNAFSRSTSRASKDSLMSSRSNSTNSRTSASTSTSDAATPERWPLPPPHDHYGAAGRKKERINARPDGMSWQCQYGSGRRWQLIAAAPALKQQRRRPGGVDRKGSGKVRGGGDEGSCDKRSKSWFKRNFLKSFVSVCQEIHAIKT